jgi:uncharacterized protein (DUF433 family)
MVDWSVCEAVERAPDRYSGAWLFRGTRVPLTALFENLEDGASIDQFVEWFPGVTLGQARSVLELGTTSWPRIKTQSESAIEAIDAATEGSYTEVPFPY